jgi:hypothetical protein
MTLILIANGILAVAVVAVIASLVAWAVRGSHHEGRPTMAGPRRRWLRHTISLRPHSDAARGPLVRPFA